LVLGFAEESYTTEGLCTQDRDALKKKAVTSFESQCDTFCNWLGKGNPTDARPACERTKVVVNANDPTCFGEQADNKYRARATTAAVDCTCKAKGE
jgi:hypothetical protein